MSNLTIHTDGGARGNPGPAAIGVVLAMAGWEEAWGKTIGETTNNVAEYQAILQAAQRIAEIIPARGITSLTFYLDSELVVKQLGGQYRVKEPTLQGLHAQVLRQLRDCGLPYTIAHVRRAENARADRLVNQALDAPAV